MIADCTFPGCREGRDGKPALTTLGACEPCRARLRRLITDVVLDFVTLKTTMPRPIARSKAGRGAASKHGYGHPAEWASDLTGRIRHHLFWHVDNLAQHLGQPTAEERPGADEIAVVRAAHGYLMANFAALARSPLVPVIADELGDLHTEVRTGMGYTRMGERLAAPCPRCDVAALVRQPPARTRRVQDPDVIRCASCSYETFADYGQVVAARVETASAARAAAIDAALAARAAARSGPACHAHRHAPADCHALPQHDTGAPLAPRVRPSRTSSAPLPLPTS